MINKIVLFIMLGFVIELIMHLYKVGSGDPESSKFLLNLIYFLKAVFG